LVEELDAAAQEQRLVAQAETALDVNEVDLLQRADGTALLVGERLALVDVEETWRGEPALAVLGLARLLHGGAGVVEPEVGDLEQVLDGNLVVRVGRRLLEQLDVNVRGLGVAA